MKIETHLSPNCSEATFVVVNWKNKQILETFEVSSDGGDEAGWFVKEIDAYFREKDVNIVEVKNSGDGLHPDIVEAVQTFVAKGKHLQKDEDEINEVFSDYESVDAAIAKCYMSNAELLAKGYIKKVTAPGRKK